MLIPINEIRVGKRLRALHELTVDQLVESIQKLGLQVPVSVVAGREKDADGVSFELVAGHHRLQACRRLGWHEIEAQIVHLNDDQRELWEIDENLCRAELSELERAEHLAKRKEVYERLHPETREISSGCRYSRCRVTGHCLHTRGAAELLRPREISASNSGASAAF
jgi:ParB family chromosome partitioning protein